MLFDLRGRRKRLIQVIYLGLAILMGGGLVLLGIGGGTSGGLLDAFSDDQSADADPALEREVETAEQTLAQDPKDERALISLAEARFRLAQNALEVDEAGQPVGLTDESLSQFQQATDAWEDYLKTKPDRPNDSTAQLMTQAYETLAASTADPDALTSALEGALEASEIVAERRPSSGSLALVARYAYLTGDTKLAAESEKKALADASDSTTKSQIKSQLKQAKSQGVVLAQQLEKAEADKRKAEKAQTPGEEELQNPLGGLGGATAPTTPVAP